MSNLNILITAVGGAAAVTMINAFRAHKEIPIKIIGVDVDPLASGLYLSDKMYLVPMASDPEYLPTILDICDKEQIDLVIPVYSTETPVYSLHNKEFESRNIGLIVPSYLSVLTCIDKLRFYEFVSSIGLPTPITYIPADKDKLQNYPLFIKPRKGSAAKDALKIIDKEQLAFQLSRNVSFIIQEYVEGQEYTIDILCDFNSQLLAFVIRERLAIKRGLAVKCRTVRIDNIEPLIRELVKRLGIVGPANIQVIITPQDEIKIIEINPRFASGGLPLSIKAGVNFPILLLKLFLGEKIEVSDYETDLYMIRYLTELSVKGGELCQKQ